MNRTFLGWDAPPLTRACDALLHRGGDLSSLIVVTPGRRVGRLLLGLLIDRSAGRHLSPPMFITPGEVADAVFGALGTPASPVQSRAAWERALAQSGTLKSLVPRRTGGESQSRGIAALLARCHDELIGEGLRFGDVPERGGLDAHESVRWADAALVQTRYEEELASAGLVDSGLARWNALEQHTPAKPVRIVLIGVPDLNEVSSRALRLPGVDVEAMIAAPEALASAFDDLGVIIPAVWKSRAVPVRDDSIVFADGPSEQAGFAMEALAKLDGRYSVHEVAIGIPDASVAPYLERAARRYAGVTARPAAGSPLRTSSVARLLEAIRELLQEGNFAAFAALVRHPDMERYLLRSQAGDRLEKWLGALDEYAAKRLPTSLSRTAADLSPNDPCAKVLNSVLRLIDPLAAPNPHPAALIGVMRKVFAGNRVSREDPSAAETIRACETIQRELAQAAAMPESWRPESGAALIRLVLDAVGDVPLPDQSSADSLELLGWLELPLDPAPVAIVTGVNDGMLPDSYGADALLPDGLRARLGIACSDRRLARDVFLMSVVVNSRREVTLISGRRDAAGDPLLPSRLLFAADSSRVVGRVRRLGETNDRGVRVRAVEPAAGVDRFPALPRVECGPVESMAVTAFRIYLSSPYLFYLTHVLRLTECERPEPELDPPQFGNLVHKALDGFGRSDIKDSTDEQRIRECVLDHLESAATAMLGAAPALTVRVQLEIARQRLIEFAAWQAEHRALGWRITHTEWAPVDGVLLPGLERPFRIRGTIDRIDTHEDGRAMIVDYKTGESAEGPERTHGKPGKWKDLQLPLYRHLVANLRLPAAGLELGYVSVSSRPGEVAFSRAPWTEPELADADAKAREVATRVRNGDFFDLGPRPPDRRTLAALCGTALAAPARQSGEAGDA